MKKYFVRRAIVFSLYKYFVPKRLNDIISENEIITIDNCDSAFVHKEWQYLIDAGVTEQMEGYPEYVALSAQIRKQLDDGLALHDNEYLYGPQASVFAKEEARLKSLLKS